MGTNGYCFDCWVVSRISDKIGFAMTDTLDSVESDPFVVHHVG